MKLFKNRKLVLMILLSIVAFISFLVLSFVFYKKNESNFVLDGYVISSSKKIFFSENASYKDSLDSKVSFKTLEKENVKVNNNSFIHYDDKSVGVFTDSVLLDLDNVSESLINYYVMVKEDIITYDKSIYSLQKYDAKFKNFLTYTGNNKFIIAGNKIRLSTDNVFENSFYEVTYKEDKVIIQTETEKYEFDPSLIDIYVNDSIMIDLLSKQICLYNNEQKDCLYNIDNISSIKEKEDNTGKINDNSLIKENINNITTNNYVGIESLLEPKLNLLNFNVNHNRIIANFEKIDPNNMISDLNIILIDKKSGKTIYEVDWDSSLNFINLDIDDLAPSNEYLLTIKGNFNYLDKSYNKVFIQKLFETDGLNISVKKDYSYDDELAFKINTQNTLINSFNVKLIGESKNNIVTYICDKDAKDCKKVCLNDESCSIQNITFNKKDNESGFQDEFIQSELADEFRQFNRIPTTNKKSKTSWSWIFVGAASQI